MRVTVQKPPMISVVNDGSGGEIVFYTDKEPVYLAMTAKELETLVFRMNQVIVHLKTLQGAKSGLLEVALSVVSDAFVESDIAGGRVVLSLKGTSGLPSNFSLAPDLADRLHVHLQQAAQQARERAKQTRQ